MIKKRWQINVDSWNLEAVDSDAARVRSRRVAGAGTVQPRVVNRGSCSRTPHVAAAAAAAAAACLKRIVNALVVVLVVDVRAAVRRRSVAVRSTSGRAHRSRLLRLGHRPPRIHMPRLLYTQYQISPVSLINQSIKF